MARDVQRLLAPVRQARQRPKVVRVGAALGSILWLSGAAVAQPIVHVRAETRIELRVERAPGRVTIAGALRDDLGQPLADRDVEIRVLDESGQSRGRSRTRTDTEGLLRATFELETGTYRVLASYEGDDGHRRIEVAQTLDLSRAHVRLHVGVPDGGRLDLDVPEHRIEVGASSSEGGGGLPLELTNEIDRTLATGTSDGDGRAIFVIGSAELGPPAAGRLIVRTVGDARRAAAQTEVPIVRFRPTQIELSAERTSVAVGEPLVLRGRLFDSAGPLPRRAVGIYAAEQHVATVLTDEDGQFVREVEFELPPNGDPIAAVARFASDAPWRSSAQSAAVAIQVQGRGATPWTWLLVPMLLSGLAVALLSRRPRAALRSPSVAGPPTPGIAGAAPTARAAHAFDVRGRVITADGERAIAEATIELRGEAEIESVHTDRNGRFEHAVVPAGSYRLIARAPGYARVEANVTIPHRGEWSDATVRLVDLRNLAVERYAPVARALVPTRNEWTLYTLREIAQRAIERLRPEVDALSRTVERAAYAPEPPTEDDVDAIATRATGLARELSSDDPGASESSHNVPRQR